MLFGCLFMAFFIGVINAGVAVGVWFLWNPVFNMTPALALSEVYVLTYMTAVVVIFLSFLLAPSAEGA